jgi:hypothetical protein
MVDQFLYEEENDAIQSYVKENEKAVMSLFNKLKNN